MRLPSPGAVIARIRHAIHGLVADQPWRMRELAVVDPDGDIVRFGTNL